MCSSDLQQKNYKEIVPFIEMIYHLSKKRIEKFGEWSTVIYFSKIDDWYVMDNETFNENAVWKKTHKEYYKFIEEIQKIKNFSNKIKIQTNFNDLINKKLLL